jgi:hypothetical protein
MQKINAQESFGDQKEPIGVWDRVASQALLTLNDKPDFTEEEMVKAEMMVKDPKFISRVKKIWVQFPMNQDPEEQERLWAEGLAQTIRYELSEK